MTNPQPLGRLLVIGDRSWGEDVVQGAGNTCLIKNRYQEAAVIEYWHTISRFVIGDPTLTVREVGEIGKFCLRKARFKAVFL